MTAAEETPSRHVVSALVLDRPGTLNRVASLLRARSFNIESLTVGQTHVSGESRMTIVIRGDEAHTHQVLAQLERLVDVLDVHELPDEDRFELELALVEIRPPADESAERAVRSALESAGGEVLVRDPAFWRLRLTDAPGRVERALDALQQHGLLDLVRAGSVAMTRTQLPSTHQHQGEIPA